MSDYNTQVIEEFRGNGGKVGGFFEDKSLLLLHHIGAKSGAERVTPLAYQKLDGGYAIFGSKGGADSHPGWYHNLLANPKTKIEVGNETIPIKARVAEGREHDEIWEKQKQVWPGFADYEQKTDRTIPVVVLEPR